MNTKEQLFTQIRTGIEFLQNEQVPKEDYDSVTHALSIIRDAVALVSRLYPLNTIRQWKEIDAPTYERFASKLKLSLEAQRDYLRSISDILTTDPENIILKKISDCQSEMESVLEKEDSVLKAIRTLSENEAQLRENKKRLDSLLQKKNELEVIEEELKSIDIEQLTAEVKEKTDIKRKLETEYRPVLLQKNSLDTEIQELRSALQHIPAEIHNMEQSLREESLRLIEEFPNWIQKIKQRTIARQDTVQTYISDLENETEKLKSVELQIQEQLHKMDELGNTSNRYQETLRKHFQVNKGIGERFSGSLSESAADLLRLTSTIEFDLQKFDELLKNMHRRIEEISAQIKPIGLP